MFEITVVNKKSNPLGYYIGRPSPLGNPFTAKNYGGGIKVRTLQESIDRYEEWIMKKINGRDQILLNELKRLQAKAKAQPINLICWCAPGPCHGDVIKKILQTHQFVCD
jgi:Domain of unknown function (DUF4326)